MVESGRPQSLQLAACQQSQRPALLFWWSQAAYIFEFQNVACCCGLWGAGHHSNCGLLFNRKTFVGMCLCLFVTIKALWYQKWKGKQPRKFNFTMPMLFPWEIRLVPLWKTLSLPSTFQRLNPFSCYLFENAASFWTLYVYISKRKGD